MNTFPKTIVIRHRKENLKKCSLRGLEKRNDFIFFSYPLMQPLICDSHILLSVEGEKELSIDDCTSGLVLLDATWRLANIMEKNIPVLGTLKKRKMPSNFFTSYPRRQEDCPDPARGLASIEALFCAYAILGRNTEGLLDHYYWKDSFLEKNGLLLV